ncbi:MAG TPA: aspartate-semialdehyde dehydrogenase [Treponemataceae bacterium]|jgi:aspartate-semialdehyde dehydrogenase|nr:aspartate-semialdehyde dehydrogenase [Treponema sp.]HOF84843.1 aspartate-semialdehyde dehydrogenase [Treponemataceae bacterium]HOS34501.1 aspartate-semialdehyde dehydrogenase [Treponemataceae bacterium]HOU38976.1 aspartate-semialdehyde dehydrogenase [Treponemataceae bacterium]HPL91078.1 aspartate-semialdehyde dehydrogenase [Treponemataceae bacterium]
MSNKIPVGILGATGAVGQNYINLLQDHPWFEVTYVAASPRSAGKRYREVVATRWLLGANIPAGVADLMIEDANIPEKAKGKCRFVFSALELESKDAIKELENAYAALGIPVVSNASAHRWTDNVPMLIPEINPDHVSVIDAQKKAHGWDTGFVAVKPNCSVQSYMAPLWALMQAGYEIKRMIVNTLQAVSGAGYPGVPSLDMIDNIVPFIGGEEEKSEREPLKIFGSVKDGKIVNAAEPLVAAHCNRVPVINGHTACVSLEFGDKKPSLEEIERIWTAFRGLPQELDLPFAPKQPIIVRHEPNRPQPRRDRDEDKGMAVSVGRLRECPVFDIRFVGLSHNTVRGAAGGGILNAELLKAKGYLS